MWDIGITRRESLNGNDLVDAVFFLMENHTSSDVINVGLGKHMPIKELAELTTEETGYRCEILWDSSKPDGMLPKFLDVTKISDLGFQPELRLESGIRETIQQYSRRNALGTLMKSYRSEGNSSW